MLNSRYTFIGQRQSRAVAGETHHHPTGQQFAGVHKKRC